VPDRATIEEPNLPVHRCRRHLPEHGRSDVKLMQELPGGPLVHGKPRRRPDIHPQRSRDSHLLQATSATA